MSLFVPGTVGEEAFDDFERMAAASGVSPHHEFTKIGRGPTVAHWRFADTENLRLTIDRWSPGVLVRGMCIPGTMILALQSGGLPHPRLCGREVTSSDLICVSHGSEFEFSTPGPCELLTATVSREAFDRAAVAAWPDWEPANASTGGGTAPLRLRFADEARRQELVRAIAGTVQWCNAHALHASDARASRLLEERFFATLFGGDAPTLNPAAPAHRHRVAKRARDYIEANAQEIVTVGDLCKVTAASERALEIGFNEVFGVSPRTYLRLRRLQGARRDLLRPERLEGTVTSIAMQWGFFHLGRFSLEYRAAFGERPSETLMRADREAARVAAPLGARGDRE